jgi:ribonucleoside-diphosphate reductase alpha chain
MKFSRTYSAPGDPYAGTAFEPRTSRIVNPDGKVVFEAKDVAVPTGWSQVATDILAQKYFRRAGVPDKVQHGPALGVRHLRPGSGPLLRRRQDGYAR